MFSIKLIKEKVEAQFASLYARFDGTPSDVHFLNGVLCTAYNHSTSEEVRLTETWTEECPVKTATYAILRLLKNEFEQLLLEVTDHPVMIYIAFLLFSNNRKYINSIVYYQHSKKMKIIMEKKCMRVKAFIGERLQVLTSQDQETALNLCKCLLLLGEREFSRNICRIWKLNLTERDWLDSNRTDDSIIYVPPGNTASLPFRISTLITLPPSVSARLLAKNGFFYNSHKNAQCFSCGSIVPEQTLSNCGISEIWHTEGCKFIREVNGNMAFSGVWTPITRHSVGKDHSVHTEDLRPRAPPNSSLKKESVCYGPRDPPGQRSVYIPPGDIAKESYRLSTFAKFPKECPANPRLLASAGFYYTGYKDRVKCFCCGICVESWTQDDDVTSSRWHHEDCQVMLREDCGNILISSLFPNLSGRNHHSSGQLTTESPRLSASASNVGGSVNDFRHSPRSGMVLKTASKNLNKLKITAECCDPVIKGATSVNYAPLRQTARPVQPSQRLAPSYKRVELAPMPMVKHEQLIRSLDLRREGDRLRSFDSWPENNQTVHQVDLARHGFFYLGNLDRVQCFSCGGVLRNWNYGDSIEREHRINFPNCRMVNGNDVHNIPLSDGERPAVPRGVVLQEPPDPNDIEQSNLVDMFPCRFPTSTHMQDEVKRFQTFDDRWPAAQVRAPPRQIAKAGFFYLGDRDHVKCWYCNGGLQNWDPNDEPWTEHAKRFPSCEYLLRQKGLDLVQLIASGYPNIRRPFGDIQISDRRRAPTPVLPIIYPESQVKSHGLEESQSRAVDVLDGENKSVSFLQSNGSSLEERIRELQDERKCKICLDDDSEVVFVPCGHLCACLTCATKMKRCLICQIPIEKGIRVRRT